MSREQLVARPIPGRWRVLEVVCHLADTDANIAHRLKRVLSEDCPTFERCRSSWHERVCLASGGNVLQVKELKFLATPEKGEVSALPVRPPDANHKLVLGHVASTNIRHATLQAIEEVNLSSTATSPMSTANCVGSWTTCTTGSGSTRRWATRPWPSSSSNGSGVRNPRPYHKRRAAPIASCVRPFSGARSSQVDASAEMTWADSISPGRAMCRSM
jgi:hypothetical protein